VSGVQRTEQKTGEPAPNTAGLLRETIPVRVRLGVTRLFLILGASRPRGSRYRFGLGGFVRPSLASMVAMLLRLL
jgi:hypothetical protein